MNTIHRRHARLAAACCAALTALTLGAAGATAATAGTATAASGSGGAPVVPTNDGPVRGTTAGTVNEFLGIPYAAPPVGNLRWRPPRPPARWRGVRDAAQFGPSCPQPPGPFAPPAPFSEDCLYLNVYTPARTGNDMGSGGKTAGRCWCGSTAAASPKKPAATTTPPSSRRTAPWLSRSTIGSARSASSRTRRWRRGPVARPATTG